MVQGFRKPFFFKPNGDTNIRSVITELFSWSVKSLNRHQHSESHLSPTASAANYTWWHSKTVTGKGPNRSQPCWEHKNYNPPSPEGAQRRPNSGRLSTLCGLKRKQSRKWCCFIWMIKWTLLITSLSMIQTVKPSRSAVGTAANVAWIPAPSAEK